MRLLTNQWYVFLAHFTEKFNKRVKARNKARSHLMSGFTMNAKNYKCVCGKKGVYLNTWCEWHKSNAFCEKCRDIAVQEEKDGTKR